MTLRSPSRGRQWLRWFVGGAFASCAYVVVFRIVFDGALDDLFGAMQLRVLLPILAAYSLYVYETRWDGVQREKADEGSGRNVVGNAAMGEGQEKTTDDDKPGSPAAPSPSSALDLTSSAPLPGEEEYVQAREIRHLPIPDVEQDREYLKLLTKSAEAGYPRALAKLGEYAMRRDCLVEAYYWFSKAQRCGFHNVDRTLLQIRSAWAAGGFHRESFNKYEFFPHEKGAVGYALLCLDSRHNMESAKSHLAKHCPDLLADK